MSAVMGELQE
jgi:hypothetical protein